MDRGPIFIGGPSRCGKTLMCALLSSHPNIAIPPKGSNMWTYFYRQCGDLSQRDNFERCLAAMLRYKHVQALNPDPDRIREDFGQGEPTYEHLFALFHVHYAEQLGKLRWGCQSGAITRYADLVFVTYPSATMIHMIRDPRDRYAETKTLSSCGRWKVGGGTARWLFSADLAKRNHQRYPDHYKIVRYETLVSQPEETVRDVCAFLDEDYMHYLLVMENASSYQGAGGNSSSGKNGRGNVSTAFVGHYRQVMSKREIAFMQTYARRQMLAYDYELAPVQLSHGDRLLFYSVDRPVNLARMLGWRISVAVRRRFPAQLGCTPPPDHVERGGRLGNVTDRRCFLFRR